MVSPLPCLTGGVWDSGQVTSFAEARVVALGRVFEGFDSNGNGILNAEDLARLRKSVKHEKGSWTTGRNKMLLAKLDRNGNGRVRCYTLPTRI